MHKPTDKFDNRKEGVMVVDFHEPEHGFWEEYYCPEEFQELHRCSKCKERAICEYQRETMYDENYDGEIVECGTLTEIYEHLTPFCPHCGAKMDLQPTYAENANHCVACNEIIPEGRQICPKCESYE